eukprot:COSAG01_NODE_2145_length_8304_cov_162.380256_7_plen_38_part_00
MYTYRYQLAGTAVPVLDLVRLMILVDAFELDLVRLYS